MKQEMPYLRPQEPSWVEYEARKASWANAHPEATPKEYEEAMRRIAQECGV